MRNPFPDSGPTVYRPDVEIPAARLEAEATLGAIPGVEGVGEGRDAIGDPAWLVYVRDHSVKAALPRELSGRAVVSEVSGAIGTLQL